MIVYGERATLCVREAQMKAVGWLVLNRAVWCRVVIWSIVQYSSIVDVAQSSAVQCDVGKLSFTLRCGRESGTPCRSPRRALRLVSQFTEGPPDGELVLWVGCLHVSEESSALHGTVECESHSAGRFPSCHAQDVLHSYFRQFWCSKCLSLSTSSTRGAKSTESPYSLWWVNSHHQSL